MLMHSKKVMNHSNRKIIVKFQDLDMEECKKISGGDNITQAVFRYFGSVWAGIEAGLPHASYGMYPGMYSMHK